MGFLGSITFGLVILAQQPAQADSAQALVQEVRALREAIEQMMAANVRVQLLMGRLQLQEARIVALSRQASDVESKLANLRAERDGLAFQKPMAEREFAGVTDPDQKERAGQMLSTIRNRLKELEARETALLAEQAGAQQLIVNEQSRWSDFNARLEEIERLLATPPGRR